MSRIPFNSQLHFYGLIEVMVRAEDPRSIRTKEDDVT